MSTYTMEFVGSVPMYISSPKNDAYIPSLLFLPTLTFHEPVLYKPPAWIHRSYCHLTAFQSPSPLFLTNSSEFYSFFFPLRSSPSLIPKPQGLTCLTIEHCLFSFEICSVDMYILEYHKQSTRKHCKM